jgi:hypothetical protein
MVKKNDMKKATKRGPQTRVTALKHRLLVKGMGAVDGRSQAAKAVKEWRSALVADLGGEGNISAQRMVLIDAACRTRLLLDHVDAFIMALPSIVNKSRRSCFPIIGQRMTLEAALMRSLAALGLERQSAPVKPFAEFIADLEQEETQPQLPGGKDAA